MFKLQYKDLLLIVKGPTGLATALVLLCAAIAFGLHHP